MNYKQHLRKTRRAEKQSRAVELECSSTDEDGVTAFDISSKQ